MRKIPVTRQMAAEVAAAKEAARIPPNVRRQVQREAIASQGVIANQVYYSRVRFEWHTVIDDGGVVVCLDPGKRYAFGYQLQQEVDGHTGHRATYADTNLLVARGTNKGETVRVLGMAVRHTPFTDSFLANAMDMFTSVTLRVDNDNLHQLGNPADIPGAAQAAEGPSFVILPNAQEDWAREIRGTRKGDSFQANHLVFAEPVIWTPDNKDSKLDVMFDFHQKICHRLPAERVEQHPECCVTALEVTTGSPAYMSGYSHPDAYGPGTFVDFMVKLYCYVESNRSVNQ